MFFGIRARDLKPFVAALLLNAELAQVRMKIFVHETLARGVVEDCFAAPFQVENYSGGVRLFIYPRVNVAFGVTDFRPAFVISYAGRRVSVNHWLDFAGGVYADFHLACPFQIILDCLDKFDSVLILRLRLFT